MKTKIIISLLGILFIGGDFIGGCEEEEPKPNYIIVQASTSGSIWRKDSPEGLPYSSQSDVGMTIRVEFVKAGGERAVFYETVDNLSRYQSSTAIFNLYKEHPIILTAYPQGGIAGYEVWQVGYEALDWEVVDAAKDFGETYVWTPTCDITFLKEQQ